MSLLNASKISKEEFKEIKNSRLALCDKYDSKEFVPEEVVNCEKVKLTKTENQGKILVGENKDGTTAFIYSPEEYSLKTYSYDESGRCVKSEYIDNRAIAEGMDYDKFNGVFSSFSPFHLSTKAKEVLREMAKVKENENSSQFVQSYLLNKKGGKGL